MYTCIVSVCVCGICMYCVCMLLCREKHLVPLSNTLFEKSSLSLDSKMSLTLYSPVCVHTRACTHTRAHTHWGDLCACTATSRLLQGCWGFSSPWCLCIKEPSWPLDDLSNRLYFLGQTYLFMCMFTVCATTSIHVHSWCLEEGVKLSVSNPASKIRV